MGNLTNSTRRLHRATYTPIRRDESKTDEPDDDTDVVIGATGDDGREPPAIGRGLEKAGFLRSLAVRPFELPELEARLADGDESNGEYPGSVLDAIEHLTVGSSQVTGTRTAAVLSNVDSAAIVGFGRELADSRREIEREVEDGLRTVRETFLADRALEPVAAPKAESAEMASEQHVESETSETVHAQSDDQVRSAERNRDTVPRIARRFNVGSGDAPSLETVLSWARTEQPERLEELYEVAESVSPTSAVHSRTDLSSWLREVSGKVAGWGDWTDSMVDGFEERMTIEPVGRLHLERLEMTPVGIERGELAYTVPLAPGETVNISHKEWSITEEEFEEIVHDIFDEYSEEGVTEKTDLSQSTESQSRHSTAYSLSANYSQYGVSAAVDYDASSETSEAKRQSRNQSIELTRKASSRARRNHKHSFKVSSVAGTEDREVRVLTNPSQVSPMRVDYYQLMRKWQVDLYRHDLRMTYDIVIPNPGADLLAKINELRTIEGLIEKPFDFPLEVTQVTRDRWSELASRYNARVPPPPEAIKWLHHHKEYGDETKKNFYDAFDVEIDSDYVIRDALFEGAFHWDADDPEDVFFDVSRDAPMAVHPEGKLRVFYTSHLDHLKGKSGKLSVSYNGQRITSGTVAAEFELQLKDAAYERWQFDAWDALRQGAEETYYENRQLLKERRESLQTEIEKGDALTLRKMEREEIMKGVLRWLFGPDFEFVPDDIEAFYEEQDPDDPDSIDVLHPDNQSWMRVMEYGEFIKYIQQAIEWENVLYFTYPYFWDSPTNWEFKRYLDHVDPRHRSFLRAGSARVVLTIRPGFEESFAALIETGAFGTLPGEHPYLTIAEEIRNYAETHYPGIPPATADDQPGEDEVDGGERGELIGRWYEYTPTSALDLSVDIDLTDIKG